MKKLKAEVDPKRLKMNFIEYLNGYSKDVQDIIDKFRLRQQVDNLTDAERLGSIIDKFTDSSINLSIKPVLDDKGREILPALDNHMMGTLFEELLRKFNEENNVTEAGEHFTPRDYVKLLADLAIIPIADQIEDNTYSIYDGACGTGGILTISEEEMKRLAKERGRKININIFGQELQPETFATCKADLMISGERRAFDYILNGSSRQYIAFGSTISEDGHKGETYDFCISNPPFGTPWKEDLKKWGLAESEKKKISDPRFKFVYDDDPEFNVIPGIGDPQMLFLANNVSRMKHGTKLGTRIVEVHNGSSLFTGDAGGGESNLRRYIIENDMLEAIIAMPEKDFYNTGIGTYIWIVTNRKEARRKGKVQLIDATSIKTPLRKNLGEKNCETNEADRKKILDLLMSFEENEYSKIFPNEEFGYWSVRVERPLRMSILIDSTTIQHAIDILGKKEVNFSQECKNILLKSGYTMPPIDTTPRLQDGDSIFDAKFAKFRTVKLPKSVGQLKADMALSQAFITLCMMQKEKEEWLDVQEFEDRFDSLNQKNGFNLKYKKIEHILPIYKNINPKASPVFENGKPKANTSLRETEVIPFLYPGGIDGYLKNEILPYYTDAWIDEKTIQKGSEVSFTKYFYKPVQLRSIADITADIRDIEKSTDGLLNEIIGR